MTLLLRIWQGFTVAIGVIVLLRWFSGSVTSEDVFFFLVMLIILGVIAAARGGWDYLNGDKNG